ncbi:hypothetical protein GCM10009718_34910 [Isoptericola halotolerans]|uniref:PKD domain-containing protein n=1 Tax=Isoptericola halotolerans TaxID=300560 RepID=A0ABX2A3I6_9MICO|nr:hypothetical protein [Isoptericola halotolerans]NOV97136.1 hypothetical protein [Isoptericola halotolerans]
MSAITAAAIAASLLLGTSTDVYTPILDDPADEVRLGAHGAAQNPATSGQDDGPRDRYFRTDLTTCNLAATWDGVDLATTLDTCPDEALELTIQGAPCTDDEYELADLWVERLRDDGTYTDPEHLSGRECITPTDLAPHARHEFATMHIPTPQATLQAREPLLAGVHYPAYATTQPQIVDVTLLDVPVQIRADPVEYTWNFDDPHTPGGATLTTTDPGQPWTDDAPTPDHTWIGHTYTHLGHPDTHTGTHRDDAGNWYRPEVTTTLTTTWQGHFRITGTSTWTTIDGTITTTSTTDPVTLTEARARLVCDDTHGHTTC